MTSTPYTHAALATPAGLALLRESLRYHAANAHTQEQRDAAAGLLRDIEAMENGHDAAKD